MPIPLFFIGVAAATGALGIGKTIKAHLNQKDATETNNLAKHITQKAAEEANQSRSYCNDALTSLGMEKLTILEHSVKPFVEAIGRLRNVALRDSVGMDELKSIQSDRHSLDELREMSSMASSMLSGVVSGTALGAATAFGAYGGVTFLASASTGTAISSLGGAAATNATLAFFGGGSLAVGGLGVAGGTMVLGGLVAAPALAVLGCILSAKASANLDAAYANLSKAREFCEEAKTIRTLCNGIRMRATLFQRLLIKLDLLFEPCVSELQNLVQVCGTDYSQYGQEQKAIIARGLAIVRAIKTLLDTSILTEDGTLTPESERIGEEMLGMIAEHA